jgi:hypothetical protein
MTCPTSLRPARPLSDQLFLRVFSFVLVSTPDLSDPFFAHVLFRSRVLSCLVLLVSSPVSSSLVASCLTMFCHVFDLCPPACVRR